MIEIRPPESLLQPTPVPDAPTVPTGELTNQDVIDWYEEWVREMQKALQSCNQDKQSACNYMDGYK